MKTKIVFAIAAALFSLSARAEPVSVPLADLRPLGEAPAVHDKNVLLYFWASWCPECRAKFASGELAVLQKEFPGTKLLTVDTDRDEAKAKAFAQAEKIELPVYRDEKKQITQALKIFGVPAWAALREITPGVWQVQKTSVGWSTDEVRAELRRMQ